MSLSITQQPNYLNLAQSPIIFTVKESNIDLLNNSTFQYNCALYYWNGDTTDFPAENQYTLIKYKNKVGYGMFDLSKILYSLFTTSLIDNNSNLFYFKCKFYTSYNNNGTIVNGTLVESNLCKVMDGYKLFGENLEFELPNYVGKYPFLTDGPDTQYYSWNGVDLFSSVFKSKINPNATSVIYKLVYSVKLTSIWEPTLNNINDTLNISSFEYFLTDYGSTITDKMIELFPISPGYSEFPLSPGILADKDFYITAFNTDNDIVGESLYFKYKCKGKYDNKVIKFKNRFGQFDNFNFNLVSSKTFSSDNKTFRKQIGNWDGTSFTYNKSGHSKVVYGSEQTQTITVNTDFLSEDYNNIFKQLLNSDEIYILEDGRTIPVIITSNSINFKTHKVDKLIQYSFTFEYSQPFKLIL